MRAILVPATGGPDVYTLTDIDRPAPPQGPGRSWSTCPCHASTSSTSTSAAGTTPLQPPFTAGVEGVGRIVETGDGVTDLAVGQCVGWFTGGQGSFADLTVVDAAKAVPIPDSVDDDTAAAVLMQGVTAHYLATDAYPVQAGDPVVVHAAAGRVGQLLTQIVKLRGGVVIETTSTPEKAAVATAAGADHVLSYEDFAPAVNDLTGGAGAAAVFDGVGGPTFDGSIAALRIRGVLVVYGNAGGPTPPLDIPRLNSGGSLYVTRPTVVHYTRTAAELRRRTTDVFGWVASGDLRVDIGGRSPQSRWERPSTPSSPAPRAASSCCSTPTDRNGGGCDTCRPRPGAGRWLRRRSAARGVPRGDGGRRRLVG